MPPLDEATLVELCLEFLEAAIAEALFQRGLYPAAVFERARLYGIAVRRARYPELRDYIHHAVQGLAVSLRQGTLDKVALVVKSPAGAALERLVFEPRLLLREPGGGPSGSGGGGSGGGDVLELEAHLRAALLKLQYAGAALGPLPPPDATWELVPYVAGREGLAPEDWIEEQPPLEATGLEMPSSGAEIVPLRSYRVDGALALQVYVERPPRRR